MRQLTIFDVLPGEKPTSEVPCSNGRYEELLDYQGELDSFFEVLI